MNFIGAAKVMNDCSKLQVLAKEKNLKNDVFCQKWAKNVQKSPKIWPKSYKMKKGCLVKNNPFYT